MSKHRLWAVALSFGLVACAAERGADTPTPAGPVVAPGTAPADRAANRPDAAPTQPRRSGGDATGQHSAERASPALATQDDDATVPERVALRAAESRPPRPDVSDRRHADRSQNRDDRMCVAECCVPAGKAVITVRVTNVKSDKGNVRVTVYPGEKSKFLERGMGIVKVDVASRADSVDVCVPVPGDGDYTIAVMHDRDADGEADKFSEGFGFSNNAIFMFGPPAFEDALFSVRDGKADQSIRLKYPFG
ncbi:hypothetical protein CCR80_02145 [Rhodothalassium salexigens]|uniref:DUF2141 domain-containing protein n=1 Tax=Rhodothalassium salexigens TaxID=1086 RepID=UPI001912DACF|nr:DUF2141 domain-containing protein [Rhodothalassium salexigens]MBK5919838.1 hypothetical protein [Rhodothalassium salexigens]